MKDCSKNSRRSVCHGRLVDEYDLEGPSTGGSRPRAMHLRTVLRSIPSSRGRSSAASTSSQRFLGPAEGIEAPICQLQLGCSALKLHRPSYHYTMALRAANKISHTPRDFPNTCRVGNGVLLTGLPSLAWSHASAVTPKIRSACWSIPPGYTWRSTAEVPVVSPSK
jgi:hypothetical protein